jgi:hypothetical protein
MSSNATFDPSDRPTKWNETGRGRQGVPAQLRLHTAPPLLFQLFGDQPVTAIVHHPGGRSRADGAMTLAMHYRGCIDVSQRLVYVQGHWQWVAPEGSTVGLGLPAASTSAGHLFGLLFWWCSLIIVF